MSFPRYPAYKYSGVEWLGEIPEHWQVKPLKRVAEIQTGLAKGKDVEPEGSIEVPFLRVANVQDGFLNLENIHTIQVRESTLPRYLLRAGDVLMNEGGDFDKLGRGCIWDDAIKPCIHQNHVFAVRPHSVRPSWLNLYTSSMQANAYFISRSKQSTNLASISSSNLMELMVPITSDIETTQIIHFLEIETAKIDALITEQQRLIQLLEEKRQAMISHAVTKGLTPDIPMKDSGGEWFGEVPEHWKTCKLSYVADVIDPNPSHRNPEYTNSGFPFISTIEFRPNGAIDFDAPRRVSEDTVREQEERCRFREGSLAFSRKGTIGAVRELPTAPRFALLDSLCVINPSATCTSQYLRLYLESLSCEKQLESLMRGAALPQVSVGDVRRLCLPLPPHDEQQAIADYLRAFVARLDKLIEAASSSRTLLQERRSALISAAVTGQIDVRGLAPVETPE